jgi:ribonucleoside-diphosphate reductase alpha chain
MLKPKAEIVAKSRYFINEVENWEGLSNRVGYGAASVEATYELQQEYGAKYAEMIYNMYFLSAGRILRNMGRPRGTLFNCYTKMIDDTIESIAYTCADATILWSDGGGVGFNASYMRPADAPILSKGGESSGPVSFLTAYNAFAETIKTGGSRRAAALALMKVSHPDIFKFINSKTKDGLLNNFNISVAVTEQFLDAVETKSKWELRFNRQIYQTIKARKLWDLIMLNMVKYAEPGILNWDNLRSNNSWYFDNIVAPNPCGEAPMGNDGSCCLGSLVLPRFITGTVNTNWKLLEQIIELSVRFLDNIINVNKYPDHIPGIKIKAFEGRRIGVGVMGLAEYLFAKKLRYGSPEALEETEKLFRNIRDFTYKASIKLSAEKGSFPKYDTMPYSRSHFIKTLPNAIKMDIKKFGIRNVTLQAVAPTGTISLLPEVTASAEPLSYKAYVRHDQIGDRAYIHEIYKDLIEAGKETPDWFVDSTDLKPEDHLETQVAIQKYTDGAVSKTILLPKGTKPEELSELLLQYIRDLKGTTCYVDGSREGQILVPIDRKEAEVYLLDDSVDAEADVETTECATGKCDIM